MNRDWHNNPSQGGSRSTHDYGNSGPIEPQRVERVWSWDYLITAAIIFVTVIVAAGWA